jgi:predicted transposase/invertase (TIGR01784 family)
MKGRNGEELEMLAKKHPEVGGAVAVLKTLSWSERRRLIREQKALWRTDIRIMKEDARAEGLAEGKAEGLAEGKAKGLAADKLEIAGRMKKDGVSAEIIAKYTGLSLEDIGKLPV